MTDMPCEAIQTNHCGSSLPELGHLVQVSITEQQELFIRFYSPRPVKEVTVWATISGYEEAFQLAKFDVLPAFTEFHADFTDFVY